MQLRVNILFSLLLLPMAVLSQATKDTIVLKSVDITSSHSDVYFMEPVSAIVLPADRNIAVEQVLSRYTTLFLKSYAPGGMNSISHRGFGSAQTLLCWNGFVLNQPTLGQPSLSGLNTSADVSMSILSGSLSAADFTGGLASVIRMRDIAPMDTLMHHSLMLSGGSFSSAGITVNSGFSLGKALLRAEVAYHQAENNFEFTNNAVGSIPEEWPTQERMNADFNSVSFRSTFSYPLGKRRLELSLWCSSQQNGIPAPLLSAQIQGNENQQSRFMRFSALIPVKTGTKSIVNARLFFSADTFLYNNQQLSISDGTSTQVLAAQIEARFSAGASSDFHLQYYPELIWVNSDNFSTPINVVDQKFKALWTKHNKFGDFDVWSHALTRDANKVYLLPGMSWYAPIDSLPLKLRLGIARNMRLPSMNDLYWATGGNPELKPEEAWMADMSLVLAPKKKHRFDYSVRLMPFAAQTANLIRWVPDSLSSLWQAENVSSSQQYGAELYVQLKTKIRKTEFSSFLNSSSVQAYDHSGENKTKLIYVPDKTLNWSVSVLHGPLSIGYDFHFTGRRFTDFDNLRYMPEIFLHDAWMAVEKKIGKQTLSLSLRVNNLLNADYQYVAWYPMPRRHFRFTLSWRFDG